MKLTDLGRALNKRRHNHHDLGVVVYSLNHKIGHAGSTRYKFKVVYRLLGSRRSRIQSKLPKKVAYASMSY